MADQHRSEKSIFLEAIDKTSPAERADFLDRACGNQSQLRSAVEALLQAHEKPQGLLDAPEAVAPTLDQPPPREGPGTAPAQGVRNRFSQESMAKRFLTPFPVEEVAQVQDVSPRTVKRNWAYARAWLGRALADDHAEPNS